MNATQIAALGEITRKAIAEAVAPLVQRIDELEKLQSQDAAKMMSAMQDMVKSIPAPYDDTTLRADIAKMIPAAYDDGELRKELQSMQQRHAKDIEAALQRIPDAYNDTELRQLIEGIAKSVPAAYDDSKLREDLSEMLKKQKEQINAVQEMVSDQPAPQNGIDGRDALHLEVLPAIDEAKSYPRGTYAKHAGGLWRSFEQTSGMRGWECIVEGVKALQVDMVDKQLSVKTVMSSGVVSEMVKELPVQIYRDVFVPDATYQQGDTVTWAGSLWHCNKTGTTAKPGDGSPDWRLAVKKGRDGREVVKTERKAEPVKIGGE